MAAAKQAPKRRKPTPAEQDRKLRERIALVYADPQLDVEIMLGNLDKLVTWVKTGRKPGDKPDLRVVGSNAV